MRVQSSALEMSATNVKQYSIKVDSKFETWQTPRPQAPRPDTVNLSDQAKACECEATVDDDALAGDPRMKLLITLLEMATGRKLRFLSQRDLAGSAGDDERPREDPNRPAAPANSQPPAAPQPPPVQRVGWGMEATTTTVETRHEKSDFTARGKVRTQDGRELTIETRAVLQADAVSVRSVRVTAGDPRVKDPLVLDFEGDAADLQSATFNFDLDADGRLERVQAPGAGGAFLVNDRNNNGRADDGRELFGAQSGDAFADLAKLDDDRNGWIDESDAAWSSLRVWRPNASAGGSLQTLSAAGVGAVALAHVDTPFDLRNSEGELRARVRATGVYLTESGTARAARQIDLASEEIAATPPGDRVV
jgi:hypothetical protein